MPKPVRRVVTGHTPDGRATIVMDGPAPQVSQGADPEGGSTVLWVTHSAPASNAGQDDAAPAGVRLSVPPEARGGTVFRIVDLVPSSRSSPSAATMRGVHHTEDRTQRHPGFHQTDTVDYALVLEGEVWAVLDDTETLLKAGDVLIQRGTYHAWDNRSASVCRIAFVLVDAEPTTPSPSAKGRG
jgi:quercetin dioxygenase-like cupin family protein